MDKREAQARSAALLKLNASNLNNESSNSTGKKVEMEESEKQPK